jgi:hypothetical protein
MPHCITNKKGSNKGLGIIRVDPNLLNLLLLGDDARKELRRIVVVGADVLVRGT